jgi:hypothetical protein
MFVQVDHADGVEPAQDELDGNGPPAETRTPSPSRSSGSDRDAYRLGSPNGTRRRPERARARGARPPVRRDPRTRIRRRQSRGRRSRLGLAGKESPAGTPPGARGRSLRSRHQGAKPAVVLLVCSLPWLPITQPRLRLRHFDEPAKDEVELDRHGFSHHTVPSVSKTATRSSTGTASAPERVREWPASQHRRASYNPTVVVTSAPSVRTLTARRRAAQQPPRLPALRPRPLWRTVPRGASHVRREPRAGVTLSGRARS